jgi:nicotinate-nucleotide adenylyltransferase
MTRLFRRCEETTPVHSHGVERLGVFGGTFDPVHVGHIVVAVETRDALDLDRVLLVVAGDPWQKRGNVVASARDRLVLVEAAVDGVAGVEASAIEIERGAPSVTADTLEALARPQRELFLVLGADAVANMHTWRRLDETRDLATIVVVERRGDAHAEPPGSGWAVERVPIPRLDISSTDLRERLVGGRAIDGLVPPAVVRAIHERGLYTGR